MYELVSYFLSLVLLVIVGHCENAVATVVVVVMVVVGGCGGVNFFRIVEL